MARKSNQKLKILYLWDYLMRESDEEHPVSMKDILAYLESVGISCERKSIYDDIEALRVFGMDIVHTNEGNRGYFIASGTFELPELKLLVDAVQSSKFLTEKKAAKLISKLESLTSRHMAGRLNRNIYVANRFNAENEGIYRNIDSLHSAMNTNCAVSFKYFEWGLKKDKVLKHGGKRYLVSPWVLCWDDENYYLVSYDNEAGLIKHFRVDKMVDIRIEDQSRRGEQEFENVDMGIYSKRTFGMFSGTPAAVVLRCKNWLCNVIVDRFGRDVLIRTVDTEHFEVKVDVCVSPPFLSWVFSFTGDMEIISPSSAADMLREMAESLLKRV